MSLAKYKTKRKFNETLEPTGGKSDKDSLMFVIQKHDASRLHYDFRLEMEGVLKSWAVPKGPSSDPSVKRLAMMVEDHPYDYRNFEGIIPKGNYGAGTVIVWDEGTYEPIEPIEGKKAQEKHLLKQLRAGSVKIVMHGKKLKGEYALVRTKGYEDNAWLLIKHNDKYASENDLTLKDKSVVSGKTLEKVETTTTNIYGKKTIDPKEKKATPKKAAVKKVATNKAEPKTAKKKVTVKPDAIDLSGAPKKPFPKGLTPMLATLVDKPFDEPGWVYEVKWDGYRALAMNDKKELNLVSRNNKSFNEKFYPIYDAVKAWGIYGVVDGEIAVINDDGITNFGALQNWRSEADGSLIYYVFDVLWLDGHDLTLLPLTGRREILKQIIPEKGAIRLSEDFTTSATEFLEAASKMGLEGIIAKKADSTYHPGIRTKEWLKIKTSLRHEVVIGGFTKNEDTSRQFSSLLVGVFKNGKLQYTGKIGTGFSDAVQKDMIAQFKPLITDKSPFTETLDVNKPSRFRPNPPKAMATWLKPQLVCEVSYREITSDGVMRHPSFEGMRTDKKAKDVGEEKAAHTEEVVKKKKAPAKKAAPKKNKTAATIIKPADAKERKTFLNPKDETQVRIVSGHELKFSNLSKVYWPEEGYTKRDMLNYYYQVAEYILPYLLDRPQSLNRFPNGIYGESFYHKDMTANAPDWMEFYPYHTSDGEDKNYMICKNEADLLYMANMGSIEMNPWNSRVQSENYPDWCLIDLDPSDKNTFDQVIKTAQVTKQVLDEINVPGYCKTSGSTGIHIYIPMDAKYTYDECQLFARWIATQVHHRLPDFTSIERMTNKRKGKIYVDFLQNRPKATLAAPYAVRPKPGATVSMPLEWSEVKKGLTVKKFTIKNAMARIKKNGDIFLPVLGKGIDLHSIVAGINKDAEE